MMLSKSRLIHLAALAAGLALTSAPFGENDRGIPGSGRVPWPEVFDALRALGYDGWLTIESFGFTIGELSAAASIWRDLAPTPDAIAFEGVRYLRGRAAAA